MVGWGLLRLTGTVLCVGGAADPCTAQALGRPRSAVRRRAAGSLGIATLTQAQRSEVQRGEGRPASGAVLRGGRCGVLWGGAGAPLARPAATACGSPLAGTAPPPGCCAAAAVLAASASVAVRLLLWWRCWLEWRGGKVALGEVVGVGGRVL